MGLFGLGWAEIGIIGVIALFIFGPDRLIPLARDLGKQSVGLKVRSAALAKPRHSVSCHVPAVVAVALPPQATPPPWPHCPNILLQFTASLATHCSAWQEITDSFSEGMSEGEKMPNLKSADAEDPPKLGQAKAKKEEK
jgi:hypothetical protein